MNDSISRQAAIDALIRKRQPVNNNDGTMTITILTDNVIKDVLKALPSAQPEIIRCRKCKFASGDSRICMKFGHSPIGELDFCAWTERKEE